MESLEVGKSFDRQAMLVFFTLEIPSGQQFRQPPYGRLLPQDDLQERCICSARDQRAACSFGSFIVIPDLRDKG
jgi:hypothetical protein